MKTRQFLEGLLEAACSFIWLAAVMAIACGILWAMGAVRILGAEPPAVSKAEPTFEDFGFPTAIEGGPANVQRNGPIAFEYDARSGNPAWTMEILTPRSIAGGAKRKDSFHADDRVPEPWRTANADYLHSPWAKGHLAASGDLGDQADQDASFTLSNVAPQNPDLNENFWSHAIEERGVRKHVRDEGLTAVVVTAVFYPPPVNGRLAIITTGEHDVWVPNRFGKAVLFLRPSTGSGAGPGWQRAFLLAWIVPNRPVPHDAPDATYRVSGRAFELELRRDLFPKLTDDLQEQLETAPPREN